MTHNDKQVCFTWLQLPRKTPFDTGLLELKNCQKYDLEKTNFELARTRITNALELVVRSSCKTTTVRKRNFESE